MRPLLALPLLLLTAVPALGQARADGRASVRIGEVLSLEVRPGGGVVARTVDGLYHEHPGAVALDVVANRPWQLHVVAEGPDGRVASVGATADPERGIWWRSADGSSGEYQRAERLPQEVAAGARGRTTVVLDYLWPAGAGEAVEPGTTLHFMLSSR